MSELVKNPPLVLLASVVAHAHFKTVSIGEAVVVAALSALYAYNLYLDSKREKPINEAVKQELAEVRSAIGALKVARAYGR